MTVVWPPTLPQSPLIDVYDETGPDIILRSTVESGKAKQRPRYTNAVVPVTMNFNMTSTQFDALIAFYRTATEFEWKNVRSGITATYRFIGGQPPKIASVLGGVPFKYRVDVQLEIVP